uniref:Reverse transcriptase domain-containing protein n=1 Tax=Cyprinus carpio TaxID=7962 RepID=A0A8C2BTG1_CYPCA
MCRNLNIHFVNGRTGKDTDGELTFLSTAGYSVIDYFIISSELFTHVKDFEIVYVDISDHFPLLYTMRLSSVELRTKMPKKSKRFVFLNEDEILDISITYNEIFKVIMSMSNGKAPGPNGIIIEIVKAASHMLCPIMFCLYNKILETGDFPEILCEAVICPLYKSGDKNDVGNYRGISLLNVLGKIFTQDGRLVSYVEVNNMFYEEQAGYRSGYNIFILLSYYIFIDFSKAFDSVQYNLLYFTLIKSGIGGKVFSVLRSMYSKLKSCVKGTDGLTEYFSCTIGVRQGCMVSPLLFNLFLNEYITMLKNNCKGIQIESMTEVQTLLYADDMANIFFFCNLYGMRVNLSKTKIMVYRRGGSLNKDEKWYFAGEHIEVVDCYKYLGMWFTPKLSWRKTRQLLASQGKKAMLSLLRFVRKHKISCNQSLNFFDHMVAPILFYGSDIRGYEPVECIENVQVSFCKKTPAYQYKCEQCGCLG